MERSSFPFRQVKNLIAISDDELLQTQILQSQPQNTILISEMPIYLEKPQGTTIAPVGSRHILLKTASFVSIKISFFQAV